MTYFQLGKNRITSYSWVWAHSVQSLVLIQVMKAATHTPFSSLAPPSFFLNYTFPAPSGMDFVFTFIAIEI